jgi:hypothetical protein
MSNECEVAGGVEKVADDSYVFIYHCLGPQNSYRIGMSTANRPLGPWSKPPVKPNLDAGVKGAWDQDTVASMNIMPDPESPGSWLGFFEGGMGPGSDGSWTMGVARASSPTGPWTKSPANPVLSGAKVHDPARCFPGSSCNGLYVASVMHGAHTNGSFWVYMEAPINKNDEGPLALWKAQKPEGPYTFVKYVLDGGLSTGRPQWDSGRYSESKVLYQDGLWHIFPTASAVGGEKANKDVEQVGWAFSADGLTFTEFPSNPIAPQHRTTPLTSAMSEGHALIENGFVHVYHTIRWTTDGASAFAPDSRNAEDLGVEIFTPSASFELEMPIVTSNWALSLPAGTTSECRYDWRAYRYCAQLATTMHASASSGVLKPSISFRVEGMCPTHGETDVSVLVFAFPNDAEVGKLLKTLPVVGACGAAGRDWRFTGTTGAVTADDLPGTDWIVTSVQNGEGSMMLSEVLQTAIYKNDGTVHS